MPVSVILLFCIGTALAALFVGFRAHLTRSREGKILAFVALFALPLMAAWTGFSEQISISTIPATFQRPTSRTIECHAIKPAIPVTPTTPCLEP